HWYLHTFPTRRSSDLYGGERMELSGGCYMKPCLANAKPNFKIVQEETFGPLLYLLTYRDFDEAIAIQNGVPQGLTSSIFTNDVRDRKSTRLNSSHDQI